jgi:hypothetical protein
VAAVREIARSEQDLDGVRDKVVSCCRRARDMERVVMWVLKVASML